jgi:hypothetical protein
MTRQKTPHTQTQQNVTPEQTDLEAGEAANEADTPADQELYERMEGAESGEERTSRKVETRRERHRVEPARMTLEGSVTTRAPKRPSQGISSHSAEEESRGQQKVVNDRPDAQAGVNQAKRAAGGKKSPQR